MKKCIFYCICHIFCYIHNTKKGYLIMHYPHTKISYVTNKCSKYQIITYQSKVIKENSLLPTDNQKVSHKIKPTLIKNSIQQNKWSNYREKYSYPKIFEENLNSKMNLMWLSLYCMYNILYILLKQDQIHYFEIFLNPLEKKVRIHVLIYIKILFHFYLV